MVKRKGFSETGQNNGGRSGGGGGKEGGWGGYQAEEVKLEGHLGGGRWGGYQRGEGGGKEGRWEGYKGGGEGGKEGREGREGRETNEQPREQTNLMAAKHDVTKGQYEKKERSKRGGGDRRSEFDRKVDERFEKIDKANNRRQFIGQILQEIGQMADSGASDVGKIS